jgi:hypothetical protein
MDQQRTPKPTVEVGLMKQPYPGLITIPTEVVPLTELFHPIQGEKARGWRRILQLIGNFLLSVVVAASIVILSAIAMLLGVYFAVWMMFEVNGW